MTYRLASALLLAALAVSQPAADNPYAPDVPEPGSIEAIARDTTDPRFLSPWVAYVPDHPSVPSPTRYLGRIAGAAGEMADTQQIYGYFRDLATGSPRVQVEVIGQSEEGREILLVVIADEDGIRDLPRLKAATAALADPRQTTPDEADRIIATARPIYYFNAGLHSDESGSAEMVMELAYRLAVSEQPMIRRIREEVMVLINPVAQPDGRDKMAQWFHRYLKGRTDYDNLPRQSPPYWGHYVYVDVNRDAHQQALATTRAVFRMFWDYHPTVVHDLHEAIALLQTWNGTGPFNPHLDPIVISEMFDMAFEEVRAMTGLGMPGVWTWDFGEGFGHHYTDSIAINHNSIGRGYETFGNATAETVERVVSPGYTTREWFRPSPPDRTVTWSMRNNTNYMQTGALAILDYTARNAREMLRNFYRKGYNSWQAGKTQPPYAFVIPDEQGDRRRVADMIGLLLNQRIEVGRAQAPARIGGREFPAGSYVVRLDQPYRNYAVDLLLPQEFPRDAEHQPYDDISWALPVHYGLEAVAISDPAIAETPLEPLEERPAPAGRVTGAGPVFLLQDTGQEGLLAARYRLGDFRVEIAGEPFSAGGRDYPAGSWVLPAQQGLRPALEQVAAELALDFTGVTTVPDVGRHEAPPPRIGVWVPWADTDSIGWIRHSLDQRQVPYTYLRDEDIRAGGLGDQVDVILYGHVRLDLQSQIHGIRPVAGPMPFTRTDEFPSHGAPVASDDITGGIGWAGLANLQQFVEAGGVLITLGNGSALVLETGFVPNVRRAMQTDISTPGAALRVRFTWPDHPVAYGYSEVTHAFRSNYPVYDLPLRWLEMAYCTSCLDGPVDPRHIVLQWGTRPVPRRHEGRGGQEGRPGHEGREGHEGGEGREGQEAHEDTKTLVVSGGAWGKEDLEGRPAILDVPVGRGRVLAFNFNPFHRDLNRADHRFVWNVILNWQGLPGPRP